MSADCRFEYDYSPHELCIRYNSYYQPDLSTPRPSQDICTCTPRALAGSRARTGHCRAHTARSNCVHIEDMICRSPPVGCHGPRPPSIAGREIACRTRNAQANHRSRGQRTKGPMCRQLGLGARLGLGVHVRRRRPPGDHSVAARSCRGRAHLARSSRLAIHRGPPLVQRSTRTHARTSCTHARRASWPHQVSLSRTSPLTTSTPFDIIRSSPKSTAYELHKSLSIRNQPTHDAPVPRPPPAGEYT